MRVSGQELLNEAIFLNVRTWMKLSSIFTGSPGPRIFIYRYSSEKHLPIEAQYDLHPAKMTLYFEAGHVYRICKDFSLNMKLFEFLKMLGLFLSISPAFCYIEFFKEEQFSGGFLP